MKLEIYCGKSGEKIAYHRLNRRDRRRVKKSPNLLKNASFIASRRLLNGRKLTAKMCLTHKGNFAALLCGQKHAGIDAEELKERDFERLAAVCFSTKEQKSLQKADDKMLEFYRIFTTKEAALKAAGLGFWRICDAAKKKDDLVLHFRFKNYLITILKKEQK